MRGDTGRQIEHRIFADIGRGEPRNEIDDQHQTQRETEVTDTDDGTGCSGGEQTNTEGEPAFDGVGDKLQHHHT